MKNEKKYFGTDGIRGKVGSFPITQTFFFKLAVSLASSKKKYKKNNNWKGHKTFMLFVRKCSS